MYFYILNRWAILAILCFIYLQCLYGMSAIASQLNGLIPLQLNVFNI